MNRSKTIGIIGAGISGLTAAWWLSRAGCEVLVLEKEQYAGGTMRTLRKGEWLVETGPNSALETTPLFQEMFDGLGLAGGMLYANPAANRRYILRDKKLYPLPMSPGAFLRSSLWSATGKLRLMKEPFVGRASGEETVAAFVERRLGKEFLDYAINPFVAGVFAGDPSRLSVRAAFPKLHALEERYGGLVRGMIRGRKERKQRSEKSKDRARMFSFVNGMQTFPDAIAASLGERLQTETEVRSLIPTPEEGRPRFEVTCLRGSESETLFFDSVVVATPASVASRLLSPFLADLAGKLEEIPYPPVAEVFLGYRIDQMSRPLDGFGYLIPEKEGRDILGTIWSSAIFPGRAPDGHVALTTFVGGTRQPAHALLDDDALLALVMREVTSIMGVRGEPVFTHVERWEKAIPQYEIGHLKVMEAIEQGEEQFPGLFLCGNYRGGISVGDCVMSGRRIAERAGSFLAGGGHRSAPAMHARA